MKQQFKQRPSAASRREAERRAAEAWEEERRHSLCVPEVWERYRRRAVSAQAILDAIDEELGQS